MENFLVTFRSSSMCPNMMLYSVAANRFVYTEAQRDFCLLVSGQVQHTLFGYTYQTSSCRR
jgi:hypothetical protein